MRLIAVVGEDLSLRSRVIKELIRGIVARGGKVGVAVHRVIGRESEKDNPGQGYTGAGASQVMVTRGKEISFRLRLAGLTPLKRVAARYFNSLDILIGDGYLDPVEKIMVVSPGGKISDKLKSDPELLAVVAATGGTYDVLCFSPEKLGDLADMLLSQTT